MSALTGDSAALVGQKLPGGEPDPAALAAAAPGLAALYERTLDHLTAALPEEP